MKLKLEPQQPYSVETLSPFLFFRPRTRVLTGLVRTISRADWQWTLWSCLCRTLLSFGLEDGILLQDGRRIKQKFNTVSPGRKYQLWSWVEQFSQRWWLIHICMLGWVRICATAQDPEIPVDLFNNPSDQKRPFQQDKLKKSPNSPPVDWGRTQALQSSERKRDYASS